MYRFEGRLTPDADVKALLRAFVEGGYTGVAAQDVPPPPSPLDWLVRGAQAKLAAVQRALETQVRGGELRMVHATGACLNGYQSRPQLAHVRYPCICYCALDTLALQGLELLYEAHSNANSSPCSIPCRTCQHLHRRCCPCSWSACWQCCCC